MNITRSLSLVALVQSTLALAQLSVTVTVDPAAERRPISPYIYGDNGQDGGHRTSARRLGGNRLTAYNWENNFSNAGNDYYYQNDSYLPWVMGVPSNQYRVPGIVMKTFHDASLARGAYSLLTAPMIGWAARDGDGSCATWNGSQWVFNQRPPGPRWRQVMDVKGFPFTTTPDTSDGFVYNDEMVNLMVAAYGGAGTPTGVKGWSLDNEPDLWASTHEEIRGDGPTYHEMFIRSASLASAIKSVDPQAEVFGPALSGFYGYFRLSDAPDHSNYPQYDTTSYPFICAFLDSMRLASQSAGRRLLDVLDLHWYPENDENQGWGLRDDDTSRAVSIDRMQRPRALWDSSYVEPTWIGHWFSPVSLLPNLQTYISRYYPGTRIALTEYAWFADRHISGGIAQADFFGVAGKYGLYMANRWYDILGWARAAYLLYRDYDGAGGAWGDVSVRAQTGNIRSLPAYASFSAADSAKLHLMLINRNYDSTAAVTISIQGSRTYNAGECWYLGRSDSLLHHQSLPAISGNSFVYSIPPLRACHLVLWNSSGTTGEPNAPSLSRPFAMWPNPARNLSELRFSQPGKYLIYDVVGRLVARADGKSPVEARAKAGIYFIREPGGGERRLVIVR